MPAWTIAQLRVADAAIGSPADISAAAFALNAQTGSRFEQDISWSGIRNILMNNFDWGNLIYCATAGSGTALPGGATQTVPIQIAAMGIRESCLYGGQFASSVTVNWNKFLAAAKLLTPLPVGGISTASMTAITALRTPTAPVWSPAVTAGDIQTARAQAQS